MEAIIPSETIKESKVLRLPQPRNEDLEHRGKLAAAYDYVPTDWKTDPVEIPVLIGAESLLRGLKKDDLGRRKKGDPRRALVTRINMSHVLHAGLAPKNSAFPKEKTSQYKFVDDIVDAPDKRIDDMPLTANTLGKSTLQVADMVVDHRPDQIAHLAGHQKHRTKTSKLTQFLAGTTTHDIATGELQYDGLLGAGLTRVDAIKRIEYNNSRRESRERRRAEGALGAYGKILEETDNAATK